MGIWMLILDHIAICCADLAEGAAWAEEQLGVPLLPGGQHARYGTHNRLLGLGEGLYLEVIAADPAAKPTGPRWFGLDRFSGPPRLGNWICATKDLNAALDFAPQEAGQAVDLARGALRWKISVPEDGSLPFDGGFPTLIEWGEGSPHPSRSLGSSGVRLDRWIVRHPRATDISALLGGRLEDPRVTFETAETAGFVAVFDTPSGQRVLS